MTKEKKYLLDLASNTWSQCMKYLIEKVSDEEAIVSAVRIIYKTDSDFMSYGPCRNRNIVYPRRIYMFIMYLHFGIRIQGVANKFGMTRANVYWHCCQVFNEYDISTEFRVKMSALFTPDNMIEMKERFNKRKRR